MEDKDLKVLEALPPPTTCRVLDFESAEVVPGFIPKTFFLIVTGTKPLLTMKVELIPRVYIKRPEFWGIEVVGCQSGIGLPATAPYHVALDISHLIGTEGIEVIGASKKQKIKVP